MTFKNNLSLIREANSLLRNRDFGTALEIYRRVSIDDPSLSDILSYNIKLAKSEIEYSQEPITSTSKNGVEKSINEGTITSVNAANDEQANSTPSNISYILADTGECIRPELSGNIDLVDDNFIHGWIYDRTRPETPVTLDLYAGSIKLVSTVANLLRNDVRDVSGFRAECGFSIRHSDFSNHISTSSLTIKISGTEELAFSSTINISVLSSQITCLSKLSKILKNELVKEYDPSLKWLSETFLPSSMARIRRGDLIHDISPEQEPSSREENLERTVSVIIPIYNGYEETINCINSALRSINTKQFDIIVINDKSPNTKLTNYLRKHSVAHNYSLYENTKNLGFVGTVNRGMQLARGNDVILLNSDTLVPHGWIDQLTQAAYSDPIVGTVTPFSNNATICSFPNFCQDNVLPIGHDVNSLNTLFKSQNSGKVVDLPTAHGFCMFIKRAVLDEIGIFDEKKWGKGYAEENDFSLRAEQRGWRNVLDAGTYVQHLGSVSFAESAEVFTHANAKILNRMYPDYQSRVAHFIRLDPPRQYRNNVGSAILKDYCKKLSNPRDARGNFILFVSLTLGGGTEVATNDIRGQLHRERLQTLMLTSPSEDTWRLTHEATGVSLEFSIPHEIPKFVDLLKSIDVWHINYHNTIEFTKHVWDLPGKLGCEYDITTHDYLSICPRVNLVSNDKYCGEPNASGCHKCLSQHGAHESSRLKPSDFNNDILKWREFYHQKLQKSRKNFAPSGDLAVRLNRYFKDVDILVRPHPEPRKKVLLKNSNFTEVLNVAFIGAIGVHKGYDYLIGCARHAQTHKLPIHFHVIGYTKDDLEASTLPNVTIHGKYDRRDLPALLKKTKCSIAALLSIWPETFSYTFSEALRNGLKVLTFDIGATSERLLPGTGSTVSLSDNHQTICEKILELAITPEKKVTIGTTYKNISSDYYQF